MSWKRNFQDTSASSELGDPGTGTQPYRFVQSAPASEWLIPHTLAGRPSVTVSDSSGARVHGTVSYLSESLVSVNFASPFSGEAHLI